jgi:DNA repair exonuclease SbcCD ATPase subunit
MSTTNDGTTATNMSKPEINLDRIEMRQDVRDILSQVEDAIGEIERVADQIDDLMIELGGLDGLREDVEQLADNLSALDLTSDLYRHIKQLRSEIERAEKDADGEGGQSSSATSP